MKFLQKIFDYSPSNISGRRACVLTLVLLTIAALTTLAVQAMHGSQWSFLSSLAIFFYFCLTPWLSIGFWSSIIGMLVNGLSKNPLKVVMPQHLALTAQATKSESLKSSTALIICIRNEDLEPIVQSLKVMLDDLVESSYASHMALYVLSDSDLSEHLQAEKLIFDELQKNYQNLIPITYRLRTDRTGYKAGNVMDFCTRYGAHHEFAISLDADSFMTSTSIVRLIRMMESDPQLGILQGLVVGMPTLNPFTRFFQFGMRLGMRHWTFGNAWWQADCGPYWGHNAIFRVQPFKEFCTLPLLKGKKDPVHILSHDQVEAVLMRRSGFDVRVYPIEDKSWEQNPPNLVEFVRRDLRWCEGNLQYVGLLSMERLRLVSRVQLLMAILMFASAPAWIGLILLGTLACSAPNASNFLDAPQLQNLFFTTLLMFYVPKLSSALEVLLDPKKREGFGGGIAFLVSFVLEILFSLLISPIMWLSQTLFMSKLLLGLSRGWATQLREGYDISWSVAVKEFWMHTLLGLGSLGLVYLGQPQLLFFALFYVLGLVLSIPLAVFSSKTQFGQWMMKNKIGRLPEESHPPVELVKLNLPALEHQKL